MGADKLKCLACGSLTISKRGLFEICPVCFWEDEGEISDPSKPTYGPNDPLSLEQARENYRKFGAVNEEAKSKVRPPTAEEAGAD